MKPNISTAVSGATLLVLLVLLGCSTSPPPPVAATPPPPPEFSRELPLEPPAPLLGRICKLGDSCMELDPRPFEACLVGTRHCVDKAMESVEVQTPKAPAGPEVVQTGAGRGGK